jgi:hypothetical protein
VTKQRNKKQRDEMNMGVWNVGFEILESYYGKNEKFKIMIPIFS